jgi:hypothetical protein
MTPEQMPVSNKVNAGAARGVPSLYASSMLASPDIARLRVGAGKCACFDENRSWVPTCFFSLCYRASSREFAARLNPTRRMLCAD